MSGTAERLSLAAWLIGRFNQPPHVPARGTQELKLSGGHASRVFEPTWPRNAFYLQEIMTAIRAVADLQRINMNFERPAIAVKDTAEPVALAAWIVSELDRSPEIQDAGRHEYQYPSGPDNLVRIFYLSRAQSSDDRLKLAAQIRSNADLQRMFVYSAPARWSCGARPRKLRRSTPAAGNQNQRLMTIA